MITKSMLCRSSLVGNAAVLAPISVVLGFMRLLPHEPHTMDLELSTTQDIAKDLHAVPQGVYHPQGVPRSTSGVYHPWGYIILREKYLRVYIILREKYLRVCIILSTSGGISSSGST